MSRVHLQCCEGQPIPAVSPKICTMKLQELHNTERPTKWSGHGKMIDPRRNSTYERPFTQEGNYLVGLLFLFIETKEFCEARAKLEMSSWGLSYVIWKDLLWSKAWNGKWPQIFRFTWVNLMMNPPGITLPWQLQITFLRFSALQGNTADWPPISYCSYSCTLSLLRNIQRPIVKQISFTATCSGMPYIYIYIQIPKTDIRKSQFYPGKEDIRKSQFYPGKTYDIPPWWHLTDNRVTSLLFHVVHDIQRQMGPPVTSDRQQSDLFTVPCCSW